MQNAIRTCDRVGGVGPKQAIVLKSVIQSIKKDFSETGITLNSVAA